MKRRLLFAWSLAALTAVGCGVSFPEEPMANMDAALKVRSVLDEGGGSSEDSAPAALAEPTGFATLTGVFKVNGTPPAGQPLTQAATHQDAAVCAPGGQAPLSQEVEVGPDGGLKSVAVYLTTPIPVDDPKWLHESYQAQKSAEVVLDQRNCIFFPHVVAVWTAQPIKLLNSDPVAHNTKIDTRGGASAANPIIPPHQSTAYNPGGEERQPAAVSCSIHPWMKAYILPRNNPYCAVTESNGTFEIAHVPAGVELEFRVWQPKLGFVSAEADVGGQTVQISRGTLKLTLNDGETREVNVTLDAGVFQ